MGAVSRPPFGEQSAPATSVQLGPISEPELEEAIGLLRGRDTGGRTPHGMRRVVALLERARRAAMAPA
jgi:hypothetical protein